MADIEKVTNLIRELQRYEPQCTDYFKDVIDAVIELLKEQEPARVVDGRPRCRFECGNCGTEFAFVYNYCPSCGRKVEWDAAD